MILRTVFLKRFYFREAQNFLLERPTSSSFHTYTELFSPCYTDDDGAYPVSLPLLISAEHLTFLSSDLSRSLYTLPPSNPSLSLRFVSIFWDLTARSSSLTNLFLSPSSLSLVRLLRDRGGIYGGGRVFQEFCGGTQHLLLTLFFSRSIEPRLHGSESYLLPPYTKWPVFRRSVSSLTPSHELTMFCEACVDCVD